MTNQFNFSEFLLNNKNSKIPPFCVYPTGTPSNHNKLICETQKLLHSESDHEEKPNVHLSRKRSKMSRLSTIFSDYLQVLWPTILWINWIGNLLIDFGIRVEILVDEMLIFGMSKLISHQNTSLWTIKCLGTLLVLLVLTVFRIMVELSMLGINTSLTVVAAGEFRLRQLVS